MNKLKLILGNQLYPLSEIIHDAQSQIYMCEDLGLCTNVKHHKSKIALFFTAMRAYRDQLLKHGYNVHYKDCNSDFELSYVEKLKNFI